MAIQSNPLSFMNVSNMTTTLRNWEGTNDHFGTTQNFSVLKAAIGSVGHLALSIISSIETIGHLALAAIAAVGSLFTRSLDNFYFSERTNLLNAFLLTSINGASALINPLDCVKMSVDVARSCCSC